VIRTLKALILPLLFASAALATTVIPMTVEDLAQASSHVLEATAVQSWAAWNPEHTIISTYTKFQVTRTLKGRASQSVVVKQIGGTLDGITQRVAGVRYWNNGEQAVLFLRPGSSLDGSLVVTGLMQGNFLTMRGENGQILVSNGVPEVSAYHAQAGTLSQYHGTHMQLQELETRVSKAVQP
jgi:hypothetical protein